MSVDQHRQARAREIGGMLVEFLKEHDDAEHDGERCRAEAVNTHAYLLHCTGMHFSPDSVNDLLWLIERTDDYRAVHQEHHAEEHA